MAINFDNLPSDKPFQTPDPGCYIGLIEKAEMKQPKDTSKPMYLNLQIALTDAEGKNHGKVFDIITESDQSLARYKLGRFVKALELNLTGEMELKDLTKIVVNKKLLIDITLKADNKNIDRAAVDALKDEIYYPMSQAYEKIGLAVEGAEEGIWGSDAEDAKSYQPPIIEDEEC